MYNQGHHQGQNAFVNGGHGHQRFGMQMNMSKPFQPNQHHNSHNQHRHQDHGGPGPSHGFGNHQHNTSNSGFTSGTPNLNASQMRNGTPNTMQNGLSRPPNEQWAQQLALAQQSRESTGTHSHARNNPTNKGINSGSMEQTRRDTDKEERNRPIANVETPGFGWSELDMSGQGLRALSGALFSYPFLRKLFLNRNQLTYLPADIGRLRNLTELDLSQNDLTDLPAEIGMLVNLKRLLIFDNHLETLPYELGSLYQLDILGIEGNPLVEDFKSIIVEEGTKALITTLQENADPPPAPKGRDWIVLDEPKATAAGPPERFSILNWNILCDVGATQTVFGYTPRNALAWEHRKEVILEEIRLRNADVVCLQEIDTENFNEFFRPALAENGYKGIYYPRARARTMNEREARNVDGCATFVKNSKYIVLDKQSIDFAAIAINRPDMKGEHDVFNRVMPRDHIAVVTFLENRQTGARLIVAHTHIFWDQVYRDVKVVQVAIFMEQLAKIAEGYSKTPACKDKALFRYSEGDSTADAADKSSTEALPEPAPSQEYPNGAAIPLIVCGDFNSEPHSGVYDLLSTGSLARDHQDLLGHNYGAFTRDGMTHPFSLRSAYGNINELRFTNYTADYSGVLDYIWYSPNLLQVTGLLGEVDPEYLKRVPGFPNWHYPSDHLALRAEFVVKPRKEPRKPVEADFGPSGK